MWIIEASRVVVMSCSLQREEKLAGRSFRGESRRRKKLSSNEKSPSRSRLFSWSKRKRPVVVVAISMPSSLLCANWPTPCVPVRTTTTTTTVSLSVNYYSAHSSIHNWAKKLYSCIFDVSRALQSNSNSNSNNKNKKSRIGQVGCLLALPPEKFLYFSSPLLNGKHKRVP